MLFFFAVGPYLHKWIVKDTEEVAAHPGRDAGFHDR